MPVTQRSSVVLIIVTTELQAQKKANKNQAQFGKAVQVSQVLTHSL